MHSEAPGRQLHVPAEVRQRLDERCQPLLLARRRLILCRRRGRWHVDLLDMGEQEDAHPVRVEVVCAEHRAGRRNRHDSMGRGAGSQRIPDGNGRARPCRRVQPRSEFGEIHAAQCAAICMRLSMGKMPAMG